MPSIETNTKQELPTIPRQSKVPKITEVDRSHPEKQCFPTFQIDCFLY